MFLYLRGVVTLTLDDALCNGCAVCTKVCPRAVLAMDGKTVRIIERDACIECGACANNCETNALTVRAGVGCAAGIIAGKLKGTEPCCDCGDGAAR